MSVFSQTSSPNIPKTGCGGMPITGLASAVELLTIATPSESPPHAFPVERPSSLLSTPVPAAGAGGASESLLAKLMPDLALIGPAIAAMTRTQEQLAAYVSREEDRHAEHEKRIERLERELHLPPPRDECARPPSDARARTTCAYPPAELRALDEILEKQRNLLEAVSLAHLKPNLYTRAFSEYSLYCTSSLVLSYCLLRLARVFSALLMFRPNDKRELPGTGLLIPPPRFST